MKTIINCLVIIILALTAATAPAATVKLKQRRHKAVRSQKPVPPSFDIPRQLQFLFKLEAHPKLNEPGSLWVITYELRVSDRASYSQWDMSASKQLARPELGVLLQKNSFTRRDLADDKNREILINLPIIPGSELFNRFRKIKKEAQVVWMNLTIEINDKTSTIKLVKEVRPSWDLRYFIKDTTGKVIMAVSPDGDLKWRTTDKPPQVRIPREGQK